MVRSTAVHELQTHLRAQLESLSAEQLAAVDAALPVDLQLKLRVELQEALRCGCQVAPLAAGSQQPKPQPTYQPPQPQDVRS